MTTTAAHRVPAWFAVGGAVLVGVLTALQARVNGQLGVRLEHGLTAAVISFGSGLIVVTVVAFALPSGRRGLRALGSGIRHRTIPWWMLIGGAAGALTVATQGLAVGLIGVSLFTVGAVAGQTVSGLLLDRVGYGPAGVVAVTLPRVAGGALALAAVAVSLVGGGGFAGVPAWMLALPFLAGVGIAWQQATNGRLRQRVGTPVVATFANFVVGTTILLIAAGIAVAVMGPPLTAPSEPWLYVGGALGVAYIMLSASIVVYTGVLLLGLGALSGQLVTSFLLDLLWPAPASAGVLVEALTVAVALGSVLVVAVGGRRRLSPAVPRRRLRDRRVSSSSAVGD